MKNPEIWDVVRSPLETGVTRVEASAGTGKTHNIIQVVLRLILEEGLRLQDILVVTFTEAATSELRERVRAEIVQSLNAGKLEVRGRERLEEALRHFDQTSIFTIHGFCQRTLRENAFESRISFETELTGDAGPLQREVAQDFWRRHFYGASPLVASAAWAQGWGPDSLARLLSRMADQHHPEILPPAATGGQAGLAREWERVWERVTQEWRRDPAGNISAVVELKLDKRVREDILENLPLVGAEEEHSPEGIRVALKLGDEADDQTGVTSFVAACMDFSSCRNRFWAQVCRECLDDAAREIPIRQMKSGTQTYHDLLTRLAGALKGPSGEALTRAVRGRYKAALMDEFQDTDPVQYAIFQKLFDDHGHFLFLIGDPKQAIYGFRGADLFTYFEAGRSVQRDFRLSHNWRSDAPLIEAVNALFMIRKEPFVFPELEFHPVEVARERKGLPFRSEGKDLKAPLRFVTMVANDGKPLTGGEDLVEDHLVGEISRLLASGATIGDAALRPRDIAVLVGKNKQAEALREKLRRHGIPSVLNTGRSVFKSEEAWDMALLLEAVLEAGRESPLKTCLLSRCIGFTYRQLVEWERNESEVRAWHERFFDRRREWGEDGFMAMFRQFLQVEQVRPRLLGFPEGERRLTNLLHLAELLHQAESELRLAPHHLLQWLHDRRADPPTDAEGHELRLDTDDEVLTIVTVHKSKGLEYPVVFCPYLWQAPRPEKEAPLYHDARQGHRLTLDLLQSPESRATAEREALAESVRRLYVAVTRARNLCVVYWGAFRGADKSPLGHLLASSTNPKVKKGKISKSGNDFLKSLNILEQTSMGTVGMTRVDPDQMPPPVPYHRAEDGLPEPRARIFSRALPQEFRMASFSGMISGRPDELVDRDPATGSLKSQEPAPNETPTLSPLADFPRGVKAGDFFHEVLEKADFRSLDGWEKLAAERLEAHGWKSETLLDPVMRTLEYLCHTPLGPQGGPVLRNVGRSQRLSEVEFSFPLKSVTPPALAQLFRKHDAGVGAHFPERLESLHFHLSEGFMQGVMDLVFEQGGKFHLVDWKTNWLGRMTEDYGPDALRRAMDEHFYPLQYHLYVLALHLYLGKRLPDYDYEKHFGGVHYVFLRGVDPGAPGRGIFQDRPAIALMKELQDLLIRK